MTELIEPVRAISEEAGRIVLDFYEKPLSVEFKADDSPLTQADRASHEFLVEQLRELTPGLPVLSEESDPGSYTSRQLWRRYWCVDPLDGTKEFVKKTTGEFTVNIALIEGNEAVLGVVRIPMQGLTYFAEKNSGAYRQFDGAEPEAIFARSSEMDRLTVVASRDHSGPEVDTMLKRMADDGIGVVSTSMGSSLKFCLVAAGEADFYPRTVPTFEWDTAAAQCIVEAAGGRLMTRDGQRLVYNKEDLRNPSIFTVGDPSLDWRRWL